MERSRISKKKKEEKKRGLEHLYAKKPFIEFIVALLSIPSLILVLILNYNSIKNLDAKAAPTPIQNITVPNSNTGINIPKFFSRPLSKTPESTPSTSASQTPCNKSLGPVSISSPQEGNVVSTNPVEVDISYDDSTYCGAVWSYSVNGSSWSPYDDNSVALYNLPNGPVQFQLQIKSLTSSDQMTLTRNFTYNGQSTAPAPTNASSSAQQ